MAAVANDKNQYLVSPQEAAARLGIGRTTLYERLLRGELSSVKIGRARRIPVAALEAYVERIMKEGAECA